MNAQWLLGDHIQVISEGVPLSYPCLRQVATAVLSITARAKRKEAEKKKEEKQPEKMDVDDDTKKDQAQEKDKKDADKDDKEKVRQAGADDDVAKDKRAALVASRSRGRWNLADDRKRNIHSFVRLIYIF